MNMIEKIKFDDCICKTNLDNHHNLKDILLSLIDEAPDVSCSEKDGRIYTYISKLDWSDGADSERPWVKEFYPSFISTLEKILPEIGYLDLRLHKIWFQQYLKGDTHGWHIHGDHYTGVYYLEYPVDAAKTQICSPLSMKIHDVDACEGDIIIFPSHWIHRSGNPNSKSRKTIVSFNFSVEGNALNVVDNPHSNELVYLNKIQE